LVDFVRERPLTGEAYQGFAPYRDLYRRKEKRGGGSLREKTGGPLHPMEVFDFQT